MPTSPDDRKHYVFGDFRLDASQRALFHKADLISLAPKSLGTLLFLVARHGRIVEKHELMEALWPDAFVEEGNLARNISTLRKILSEDGNGQSFIETIPKRGYRFVASVQVLDGEDDAPNEVGHTRPAGVGPRVPDVWPGPTRSIRHTVAFALLASGVLLALGLWIFRTRAQRAHAAEIRSLAVLPLEDLSPNPGQEYFAEGITEELITNLAQSLPVRVISHTSVMRYKQTNEPVTQIARELGVEAIVEGAVARYGNQVTVTVQLIDATEDRHLWAKKYHRELRDFLGMESELAQQIASQVGGTLRSQHQIRALNMRQVNPEVYQLYLKGRYFWNKRTDEGVLKASEYFRQAADSDANYAQAYVGLADCYLFGQPPTDPPKVLAAKAKAMAKRALEIDDSLGEPHATLALVAENIDRDWAGAEKEYKRAIDLNPNYATAHHWYAEYLALLRRFDEALVQIKTARDLDPLSLIIIKDTGEIYYAAHEYDQATEYFRKALEMDPNFVLAHRYLGMVYVQKREFASAIAELERARQLEESPDGLAELGFAYAISGRRQEARKVLDDLKIVSGQRYASPRDFALIYTGLGTSNKAFEWLEKGYREDAVMTELIVDPRWDGLRGDSRFTDLIKRIGPTP